MTASVYHVISTEKETHISKHNWIFRRFCIYKQPTLTKCWNFTIFAQILYSYFRYTGRLFLGCLHFVACCNTIRASWETKKERLSYRKKYIEEFVWGISLFWLHALILLLSLSTPPYPSEVLVEWPLQRQMFCYVWYSVWWYHALTVENMKISYNLIFYVFFYKHCFFPTRPRCSLAFLWIELEMLLRCYLIHMIIIIHSIFYV